jgi:chemotaxis protein MotB
MRRPVRRRAGRQQHAEHSSAESGERWTISYMDMITVLLCVFVVLFAMSSIDVGKYDELRKALSEGFGFTEANVSGITAPAAPAEVPVETPDAGAQAMAAARAEVDNLRALQGQLEQSLADAGFGGWVQFGIDERGLALKLTGSDTYFQADTAELRPEARRILSAVAPILSGVPNQISIEGYTNAVVSGALTSRNATHWTLSASRATNALLYLVESGVDGGRMTLTGYGAEHPVSYDDPSLNRRVEIVVRSALPEDVRVLIPQIAEAVRQP